MADKMIKVAVLIEEVLQEYDRRMNDPQYPAEHRQWLLENRELVFAIVRLCPGKAAAMIQKFIDEESNQTSLSA